MESSLSIFQNGTFMQFLNPKPIGAFIEYTLKPLLDDARELIIALDEKGFKKDDIKWAFWLFMVQIVFDFVKAVLITGMICYTLSLILKSNI